ncbi:hypothetical protein BDK51DRAFT_6550, partial [Blyttiomyces helicus]
HPEAVSSRSPLRTVHTGTDADASHCSQRRKYFGENCLPPVEPLTIFQLMYRAMQDKTLIFLSLAAVLSLSIGIYQDLKTLPPDAPESEKQKVHWIEGVSILAAVVVVVLAGSVNDYEKEKQFRALNAKKENREVKVLRDGQTQLISVY